MAIALQQQTPGCAANNLCRIQETYRSLVPVKCMKQLPHCSSLSTNPTVGLVPTRTQLLLLLKSYYFHLNYNSPSITDLNYFTIAAATTVVVSDPESQHKWLWACAWPLGQWFTQSPKAHQTRRTPLAQQPCQISPFYPSSRPGSDAALPALLEPADSAWGGRHSYA